MFGGIVMGSRYWPGGRGAVVALALTGALGPAVTADGTVGAADVGWNRVVAAGIAVSAAFVGDGAAALGDAVDNTAGQTRVVGRAAHRAGAAAGRAVPTGDVGWNRVALIVPAGDVGWNRAGAVVPTGDVGWNSSSHAVPVGDVGWNGAARLLAVRDTGPSAAAASPDGDVGWNSARV